MENHARIIAMSAPETIAATRARMWLPVMEATIAAVQVGLDGIEGYVDGAMRVSYSLAKLGPARIDLGLGAWGAAQRGASRIDAGPWLSTALPVAGRSLRLSIEWRQRLAGRAEPTSGPALTIGTDF